ncbi:MAG TPA: hypothetical protein VGJ14_14515 [Sporichthyaceae bacterium]
MSVRTQVVRPSVPPALRLSAPRARGYLRSLDAGAGLLGALATVGLLMLSGVVLLGSLLLSVQRDANALTSGLTDASLSTNLLMALLLTAIVVVSFATGGYVAARLATTGGRLQGVAVWACAMTVPALGVLLAAAGNTLARTVLDAVTDDPALLTLTLSVLAAGLLGALLGADAAQRHRSAALRP